MVDSGWDCDFLKVYTQQLTEVAAIKSKKQNHLQANEEESG